MEQINFSVITSIIATMNNTKPHTILEQLRYQTKIINAWNNIAEQLDLNQTELNEDVQEILTSLASLTSRVDGIADVVNSILSDLADVVSRLTLAETNINNNTLAITGLTSRIGMVESDISSLQARITALESAIANKQDTLVSGTNIKTIGGTSILGSGDIPLPSISSLYMHVINFVSTEYGAKASATFVVFNNSATPFTWATLQTLQQKTFIASGTGFDTGFDTPLFYVVNRVSISSTYVLTAGVSQSDDEYCSMAYHFNYAPDDFIDNVQQII